MKMMEQGSNHGVSLVMIYSSMDTGGPEGVSRQGPALVWPLYDLRV